MIDPLAPYRCEHGHLVLGCPEEDCAQQNDYLAKVVEDTRSYAGQMQENARLAVRELVEGLL